MTKEITNSEDAIDSRDIIERIKELEKYNKLSDCEEKEHNTLQSLDQDGRSIFSDNWEYGVSLVRDSHFETYAQELAEDIGAIDSNAKWPVRHIDWESAAEELKMDYNYMEFDGEEYWAK